MAKQHPYCNVQFLLFQSKEKESLFRILAAILRLGNMFFGAADVIYQYFPAAI